MSNITEIADFVKLREILEKEILNTAQKGKRYFYHAFNKLFVVFGFASMLQTFDFLARL